MSEVLTGEEEVYRTWPDRSQMSPVRREVMEGSGSASVSHLPPTKPMSMAAALENLNISYSVGSKCLQSSHGAQVETDENEAQHIYYKPGHRKAYSLPRTLEGGSKVEQEVELESPRTTLQRYGLQYQPWRGQAPSLNHDCCWRRSRGRRRTRGGAGPRGWWSIPTTIIH